MALKSDGTVWAWGENSDSQLGDNTNTDRLSPIAVLNLTGAVSVSAGNLHSIAVKSDGSVWAWGKNDLGQLGDGTVGGARSVPVEISNLTNVVSVAAGWGHSVAVKSDGTVWAWGSNGYGQLGDGTTTNRLTPVQTLGISDVVGIAASYNYTVALKSDGTVWAWGYNFNGALGDNTRSTRILPVQVVGLTGVVSVGVGLYHTVGLKADGTVYAWGANYYGQLGDNSLIDRLIPVPVTGLTDVFSIAPGGYRTVVVKSNGTVFSWGNAGVGALGDASTGSRVSPAQIVGASDVVSASSGINHSVMVKSDGTIMAFGSNTNGELGDGTRGDRLVPTQLPGLVGASSVSYTTVVKSDGTVWAWGSNGTGSVGDGSTTNRYAAVQVQGLAGVTSVSDRGEHTLALKSDGTVWAWGSNTHGQLGDGSVYNKLTPVQVPILTGIIGVSAGTYHSLAVKADGTVWSWGDSNYGKLGRSRVGGQAGPGQVLGLTGVIGVAAGQNHSVAIKSDGTVWAWGYNASGQLGDTTGTNRSVPVQVVGITGVVGVSAGDDHTVAVKSDGTVWAWGSNLLGQIGDGTTVYRYAPVEVPGVSGVVSIAAATYHTVAVKSDGTLWAWGANTYGQLGDNSRTWRLSPARVNGLYNVISVSVGFGHTVAVMDGGTVSAWGYDGGGQLGINSSVIVNTVSSTGSGLLNLGAAQPPPPPPPSKVIFLHGFMGSRLHVCEQGNHTEAWPTFTSAQYRMLELPDAPAKKVYVGSLLDEVAEIEEVYKGFELYARGYPGFEALTYDWRLSLDEILDVGSPTWNPTVGCANAGITDPRDARFDRSVGMLARVKAILDQPSTGKITIITHSNGGLLAKRLVQRLEADAAYMGRIDKLIFVAVPHFGAPQAVAQAMHGTDFPPNFFILPSLLKAVAQSLPATYNLLPSTNYFASGGLSGQPVPTVAEYVGNLATYQLESALGESDPRARIDTFAEFQSFAVGLPPYGCLVPLLPDHDARFFCIGAPEGVDSTLLSAATALHTALDNFVIPAGIKTYQIVGAGKLTVSALSYSEEFDPNFNTFKVVPKTAKTSLGDGTVPYRSALGVDGASTFVVRLGNCSGNRKHSNILELPELQSLIARIIGDRPTDATSLGEGPVQDERCVDPVGVVTAGTPAPSIRGVDTIEAYLASPADLHVYDSNGAHTGRRASPRPSSDLQWAEEKIPGSSFGFPHSVALLTKNGPYLFEIRGNGSGVASMIIERRVDDVQVSKVVYPNFLVTPRTIARVSMTTANDRPSLMVDTDGDGSVDIAVSPAPSRPPVAVADGPSIARLGSLVSLNGERSYDPDNGPERLQYAWSITSGQAAPITRADSRSATFIPTTPGTYNLSLVVSDGAIASAPAQVRVVVPLLGDINGDGRVDSNDLRLVVNALWTPANGPNDLRDLNGDGKIDPTDVSSRPCKSPPTRMNTRYAG